MTKKVRTGFDYYKVFLGGHLKSMLGGIIWTGEEDMKGFNEYRFYDGKLIEDWPAGITFFVEAYLQKNVVEEDYIFLVFHWHIVSERVRRVFEECRIKGVQFLPVRIIQKDTGKELGPYWAMNVYRETDALDWDRTVWVSAVTNPREDPYPSVGIIRVVLRREPVAGLDIFRLNIKGRGDTTVYISRRVKECLEKASATSGFEFHPVEAY